MLPAMTGIYRAQSVGSLLRLGQSLGIEVTFTARS